MAGTTLRHAHYIKRMAQNKIKLCVHKTAGTKFKKTRAFYYRMQRTKKKNAHFIKQIPQTKKKHAHFTNGLRIT